jgi:hypothetical protein
MGSPTAVTMATESATAQPGAAPASAPATVMAQPAVPKTSAAFSPPNPNEVLSTRR